MTTVWLLILVILGVTPDSDFDYSHGHPQVPEQNYVIDEQPTRDACYAKLESVWADMREAYVGDETYAMKCACRVRTDEGKLLPCPKLTE